MRQFVLLPVLVWTILASPIANNVYDYADKKLGMCNLDGLSPYVFESFGLDPSKEWTLDEESLLPLVKLCRNTDLMQFNETQLLVRKKSLEYPTVRDEYAAIRRHLIQEIPNFEYVFDFGYLAIMKAYRVTGELGMYLCDVIEHHLFNCLAYQECESLQVLPHLTTSVEEREKTWIEVRKIKRSFAIMKDMSGRESSDQIYPEKHENALIQWIIDEAQTPAKEWLSNCMETFKGELSKLSEKYCAADRYPTAKPRKLNRFRKNSTVTIV